jgi:predicted Zn-dependent protease
MGNGLHPKLKGLLWLATAVGLAAFAVLAFGLAVRQIPRQLESRMGQRMVSYRPAQLCHRPDSSQALRELVARIYPQTEQERTLPITVDVVRGGPVNAFASLGPRIYVFETLIAKARSPEELAGVLAHEMGHVTERHVLESVAFRVLMIPLWLPFSQSGHEGSLQALNALAQLKFSRGQEYEADSEGLARLQKAAVDPGGLAAFFDRLKGASGVTELLSDHPSSESRAKLAELYPVEHPRPILTEGQWQALRRICED